MKTYITALLIILAASVLCISCHEEFLDVKPDKALIVPTTLEDFQALLDNDVETMNQAPALGQIASDDYYTTDAGWLGYSSAIERNSYVWATDVYEGAPISDWNRLYQQIFYANVVLEGMEKVKLTTANAQQWKRIKGEALFHRAYAFFNLAQIFAPAYDAQEAETLYGIPLRLSPDVNIKSVRGNVQQTYDRIIEDLLKARPFLPVKPAFKTRPSATAVYALLARVFLAMEDYEKAGVHADSALFMQNTLMNFNNLNAAAARPVPQLNDEILFYSTLLSYSYARSANTIIEPLLYSSYSKEDRRKVIFFTDKGNGIVNFKGSYAGINLFGGLASDEMYLIRAECSARAGNINSAMNDLNALLETRWRTGTFLPFAASTAEEALSLVLAERRKELIFRGLRWNDLRRLNKDPRFSKTLVRDLNGNTFTLLTDDLRYVFPIPDEEINASGIQQNPR